MVNMKYISFLLCLFLSNTSGQKCRLVQVCDDNTKANNIQAFKGDKGDRGPVGPQGYGSKGTKGDPAECKSIKEKLTKRIERLENLVTHASCETSPIQGIQKLRSGENAFCDNGWTVFQRRSDGSVNFDRNWKSYKNGFGKISGEFWLGLDKIHSLTRGKICRLRVTLRGFDNRIAFAQYSTFWVEDEIHNYKLHVGGYNGNAGDSLAGHNLKPFTTNDRDNDGNSRNCASSYSGRQGGWWYGSCFSSSLNAIWGISKGYATGIVWSSWKGFYTALKATTMELRCD